MIIPDVHDHQHAGRSTLLSEAAREISSTTGAAAKSAATRFSHLMARYLVSREDDDDEKTYEECHPKPNIDLCEKQAAAGNLHIVVPVCIAAVLLAGLLGTLVFFHFRRKKRDEAEWSSKNIHEMEDYGIEVPVSRPGNAKRR